MGKSLVLWCCLLIVYLNLLTLLCVCRSWIDSRFDGTTKVRQVNQILGNLCRLHYPGVVTLPSGERQLATTWDHYRFAPDGDYGTAQGAVSHDFWVRFFFMYEFFFTHDFWSYSSLLILMHFLLHTFFCSYVFACQKQAITRITHLQSLTTMHIRLLRTQFPMLGFRRTISITRRN